MKPTISTARKLKIAPGSRSNSPTFRPEPYLPLRWNSCPGLLPSGATKAITM